MKTQSKCLLLLFILFVHHGKVTCNQEVSDIEAAQSAESSAERHEFQTEVGRLMDIIINSLYTQKEIFLRELISNASDALDKIRFLSVQDPDILGDQQELAIRIEYDQDAKTLSIFDTGCGMTKQDLINNLGTIAKSGTTNFIEAIKGGNLNLIGQFGVGFYSSFLAGSKVTVVSKSKDDDQYIWESSAAHSFTINKDPRGDSLKRGTKVIITLKQDAVEFVEEDRIKELVKKYSEFINFPIYLRVAKETTEEVEDDEATEQEQKSEESEKKDDLEVKDEEENKEEKKKKTKTIKTKTWEWEQLNNNKAIWLRDKSEVEDEEYNKFYKQLTKDTEDPLDYIHFKAEGEVEFRALLFTPKKSEQGQYENYYGKSSSLKLYVRRVLINEEFEELMPKYLNFIKGVIDSDDLPLNVSRESLQQLKMLKVISRKLVRKALEMLKNIASSADEDDEEEEEEESSDKEGEQQDSQQSKEEKQQKKKDKYIQFFKQFGKNIKIGVIEDAANRAKLAKLTRWYSSHNTTELISLDDYLSRAKTGQDYIYYIAGENKNNLMKAPALQTLMRKGYEVLLLDDPIDEFCFQHLNEYEKKRLINVEKGEFKFPEEDDQGRKRIKRLKKFFQPLTDWWKNLMGETLESVIISQRLVDDPVLVVSPEHGYSANMERITKSQTYGNRDRNEMFMQQKKILELNPNHPIVKELLDRVKENESEVDKETEDYARMLTETALVNSGYTIQNPQEFASRFYNLFKSSMGISRDAKVEEFDVGSITDDEDDDNKKSNEKRQNDDEDNSRAKDDL